MEKARYADIIRRRMKTKENPTGAPISIRDAEKALGYSYEHIRKVVRGEPVASKDFNERICGLLGLDADEMWRIAQGEKLQHKYGPISTILPPSDDKLKKLWPKLNSDDRDRVYKLVEALAGAAEATARAR